MARPGRCRGLAGARRRSGLGHRYSDGGGTLYELNPATGAVEHQIAISDGLPHFSSLSLGGGTAYLGTMNGVTAVNGV